MNHIFKSKFLLLLVGLGLVICMGVASVSSVSADNPAQSPQPTSRPPEENPAPAGSAAAPALDGATQTIVEELARRAAIPAERLMIGYSEEWKLPLTGASFTYVKAVDTATGADYALGLDGNGKFVDPEALRFTENAAMAEAYGKLHPSLYNQLKSLGTDDRVQVSIWLDLGGREAWLARPLPEEAAAISADELRQAKADNLAYATQVLRLVEGPLLRFLPSVGGHVLGTADTAPLVFTDLPASAVSQVADLSYVLAIDLMTEGGPEEDGGGEKGGGVEMATARPASKANIVEARGITGTGVTAAVVEGDSIEFANPYIVDGTCGPTSTCPNKAEHPTTLGGIFASTHSTARGTAPGIGNLLLSANGSGWNLAEMQTATSWALGQSADVLNNSYYLEIDGVMHNSDRWMDYLVRNSWVLEVKSAGNRGESEGNVTSPGMGYNSLTVGAAEDKDTITWDDDTMAEFSSWVQPAGRQKPEVTAIGCGEWVSGTGGVPGIVITGMASPWIYDQGCGTSYSAPIVAGGGALLIQRSLTLDDWPEAEKAILIASALHNIEGDARSSDIDGAGAVDLAAADAIAANGWWGALYLTPGTFDVDFNYTARTIHLYAGERVRAALAYDANPAADYGSEVLEGDLDLYLLDSAGTIMAVSSGVDSWEIIDYTVATEGDYTLRIRNFGGSLSGSEWTYAGFAIWPGHYVLQAYTPQTRDTPSGAWNQDSGDDYRLTRSSFWNALGIRSPSTGDYDIFLFNNSVYGDPADHARLEDSTTSTIVDFMVIDGNHAPSGDYYATISTYAGTGNYNIEFATRTTDVLTGTFGPYTITPAQVVRVWDAWLDAGVRKYYALRPTSGDADLGMALFDSDPATSTTWYQGRSQYIAYADSAGAGGAEFMSYQAVTADWHGLVVWNTAATSTTSFYLYADTDAPTGTIAVNSGAAAVNTTAVTLNLSASDAQTGVTQMRFSNDNATWSSLEPYAATFPWTLTAGEGTKTVYAQFVNNVGLVSASVSDTILLDQTAPTGTISINSGLAYTNNTSVTLTLAASDALSGVAQMQFSNNGSTFSAPVAYAASYPWTLATTDGTKTVYVRYIDTAGNTSGSFTDTIILDTTAPTGTVSINSGATYTASTGVTLTLSASDGLSGMSQMRFSNDNATWGGWTAYATSAAWTLSAGDGTKTVYVQYRDIADNGSGSFTDTIILDTTAPTGSVSINGGAAYVGTLSVTLTLSATDAGSGVAQMRFSENGTVWTGWEAYATTRAWALSAGDGVKTVYVQYRDVLNNASGSFTDTIIFDTTGPSGTISINAGAAFVNTTNVTLTLSATDTGSGVAQMRFSNDASTWSGWTAYATSYPWTLATVDGIKTVYAQYRDALNNASGFFSDTITLDTVVPTGTISINSGAAYISSTAATLTLSAGDAGSGVALMRFSNDNVTWGGWTAYATSAPWMVASGDGLKTVYAQYRDNAGNDSVSYSDTILLDQTAPTGTVVINSGDAFTATASVTLTLSASDAGIGVSQMRFSNDGVTFTSWEAYAVTRVWTLSPIEGVKTVYVQYRDVLNNASGSFTDTITLDTTSPAGTILINSGAVYTTTTAVTLALTASDVGSGLAQMRFSNDNAVWTAWETYAAFRTWTLSNGDGLKTVYVQFRDVLNNASDSFSDGINLDDAAPVGSISVNSGAAYTNNTAVTLTLAVSDVGSSVAQMRFSNDGAAWSGWEAYAASKAWTILPGDGTVMVYAQFIDLNGNVSDSLTDTIILDTVAPSSSATSPAESMNPFFTVSWSGSDTLSGIASYDVQYRVGAAGMWTDWLSGVTGSSSVFGSSAPVVVSPGETYYFRVRAHDAAGNVEAYPSGNGDSQTFVLEVSMLYMPYIQR
jgi:hypothetical protein